MPNAPACTTRALIATVYRLAGREPRITALPRPILSLFALFVPLMRELKEMAFQWDRPYLVDHSKYAGAFGEHFTPLDEGLAATLAWYRGRTSVPAQP